MFDNGKRPTWCLGCGHFGVLNSLKAALSSLGLKPENTSIVSGIGCSGRIFQFLSGYNFHSAHGRALTVAQGIKSANKDLCVIAAGGDGDGLAIGLNHTLHAMRRNMDITYLVMSNGVYGLTKGHTSPTSSIGFQTKSTPFGSQDVPINPLLLSLSLGTSFVAQGFSGNPKQLARIIEQGIKHRGFSFINIFSPCVTFNKINTYSWYMEHLYDIDNDQEYDNSNLSNAIDKVMNRQSLVTGIIYENPDQRVGEQYYVQDPSIYLSEEQYSTILSSF